MTPQASPRRPDRSPGRPSSPGPRIGPLRLTPTRVLLSVAVVGGSALTIWALARRDEGAVPVLATGMLVLGITFGAIAVAAAVDIYRSAADDRSGRALLLAIGGGIAAIAAFGCLAAAAVLALLWRATPA